MSFSSVATGVIGTVAPLLGTALGGPLGGMAGGLLAKWLGKKDPNSGTIIPATIKEIEAALAGGSPETMVALKQAENELTEHMKALEISEEQLTYADTDSARKREIAVKDYTPAILAYALTVGFFTLIGALLKIDVPADNKAIIYSLVGTLGSSWGLAIGYYFGSSRSSSQKTDALVTAIGKK